MRPLLVLLLLLVPQTAWAHSPVPGIEGFYLGVLHPLKEIQQGLVVISLGLLLGQRGLAVMRRVWLSFAVALAVGLATAIAIGDLFTPAPLLLALALAPGIAVVVARPLDTRVLITVGALAGIAVGIASTPEPGPWSAMTTTISGSVVGANLLLLYSFGIADKMQTNQSKQWLQIGLRVLGSWIVAVCTLMLAFAARG